MHAADSTTAEALTSTVLTSTALISTAECYALVEPELARVRQSVLDVVPPESQLLATSLAHSLHSTGKLARPTLLLLCAKAFEPLNNTVLDDRFVQTAAVAEMIHVATLLHDDVLDDSDLRRGKTTVRAQFGNTISILSGDYLLAQASRKLAAIGNVRLVAMYAQVLSDLCDGEVEQLRTSFNIDTTWDTYLKKSICKTASLFSAACESAGVLAELPENQIQQLITYGREFGIAFQILDDLLDYTASAEELGKPVLDDLRHGLLNAPILLALHGDFLAAEVREALYKRITYIFNAGQAAETPAVEQLDSQLQQALQILKTHNLLEETRLLAEQKINTACNALGFLPPSPARQALISLARNAIQRRA